MVSHYFGTEPTMPAIFQNAHISSTHCKYIVCRALSFCGICFDWLGVSSNQNSASLHVIFVGFFLAVSWILSVHKMGISFA